MRKLTQIIAGRLEYDNFSERKIVFVCVFTLAILLAWLKWQGLVGIYPLYFYEGKSYIGT